MSFITVLIGVIAFGLFHGVNPSHGWPVALLYSMRSKRPLLGGIISSSIISGAHFVSSIVVVIAYILIVNFTMVEIPQLYMRYAAAIALGVLAYIFWKEKDEEDFIETQHGHLHEMDIRRIRKKEKEGGRVEEENHEWHQDKIIGEIEIEHEHLHWHKNIGYHSHIHIHQKRKAVKLPSLKKITSFAFILGFAHEEEFVILALAASGSIDPLMLMIAYATSVSAALIGVTVISMKVYQHFQYKVIYYSKYLPKITAILIALMAVGFVIGLL